MQVPWHGLTEASLLSAIQDVLDTPGYQEAATKLGQLILDQPQHPLDKAVWWLEYLLRHPGNPGMVSPTHKLNWFQYFLLDVLVTIITATFIFVYIIVRLISCCCRRKKSKTD